MIKLTVFTPTYNRINLLERCYKSLLSQNNKNFIWLIIDDGSTDNTEVVVSEWIKEQKIIIKYFKQKNGGMYSAHNAAYKIITTELNMCIDSDDYLADNAIDKILRFWNENKSENIAGIIALNISEENEIIGSEFPDNIKSEKLYYLYNKYGMKGDKKLIYRTDIIKKFKYPVNLNERYIPSTYIYYQIDKNYNLAILREAVCVVCYQENGMSKSERKRLVQCPKNSALYFNLCLSFNNMFSSNLEICAKYLVFSYLGKNCNIIKNSNNKIVTFLSLPIAIVSYFIFYKKYCMD